MVDLQDHHYYWLRNRENKENRSIVIMPTHPKLTQVPRVIHDVLDVMGRPSNASLWSKINSSNLGHPSVFGYISDLLSRRKKSFQKVPDKVKKMKIRT